MKNGIVDLNNHLFVALERLNEEGLDEDKVAVEIERSKAIAAVATQIINTGNLALKAAEMRSEGIVNNKNLPLIGKDNG